LYHLCEITLQMKEYEEAIDIALKLHDLIPRNSLVNQLLSKLDVLNLEDTSQALKMENSYKNGKNVIWKGLEKFSPIDLNYDSTKWDSIKNDIRDFCNSSDFETKFIALKRKCGIDTGLVEQVYSISATCSRRLITYGIQMGIIWMEYDAMLRDTTYFLHSKEIAGIIADNVRVYDEVYDYVLEGKDITIEMILRFHSIFTETARYIYEENEVILIRRGKFKRYPNYLVNKQNEVSVFCMPSLVEKSVHDLLLEYYALKSNNVSVEFIAAWFHLNFIMIHPFDSGNGRVAQALVSFILIQQGLLPFSVNLEQREEYFAVLDEAIKNKNSVTLMQFILENQLILKDFILEKIILSSDP